MFTVSGNATVRCGPTVYTLQEWQQMGRDVGSTVNTEPGVGPVIEWAKQVLEIDSPEASRPTSS